MVGGAHVKRVKFEQTEKLMEEGFKEELRGQR